MESLTNMCHENHRFPKYFFTITQYYKIKTVVNGFKSHFHINKRKKNVMEQNVQTIKKTDIAFYFINSDNCIYCNQHSTISYPLRYYSGVLITSLILIKSEAQKLHSLVLL